MDTLRVFRENVELSYIYGIRDMGDGTFTFGKERVYRIGGDEFAAVLENASQVDVSARLALLDQTLAEANRERSIPYCRYPRAHRSIARARTGNSTRYSAVRTTRCMRTRHGIMLQTETVGKEHSRKRSDRQRPGGPFGPQRGAAWLSGNISPRMCARGGGRQRTRADGKIDTNIPGWCPGSA